MRNLQAVQKNLSVLRRRTLLVAGAIVLLALGLATRTALAQQFERGQWSAPPDLRGLNNSVLAMTFDQTGSMYVGGYFTDAGGDDNADHIAKWDGKKWLALGAGFNRSVQSLAIDSRGNVYAGGIFNGSGDSKTPYAYVARWNGTRWDNLVYGLDGKVLALAIDSKDRLYVGGDFLNACRDANCNQTTPMPHIARWTGTQWESVGGGFDKSVNAIVADKLDNIYAGGDFVHLGNGTGDLPHIAKWNGTTWSSLDKGVGGSILPTVHALAVDGIGNVYVSGRFALAGQVFTNRIAKWDGTRWNALQQGTNFAVYSLITDLNGALYAGGLFTQAGETTASRVAKWDPRANNWFSVGGGLDNTVFAFAYSPNHVLFAGGDFLDADGDPNADRIAQWIVKTALNTP